MPLTKAETAFQYERVLSEFLAQLRNYWVPHVLLYKITVWVYSHNIYAITA